MNFDRKILILILACWLGNGIAVFAGETGTIHQDVEHKLVTLVDGQGQLELRLNYGGGCTLDRVTVRGRQVIAATGVGSGIRAGGQWFTIRSDIASPEIMVHDGTLTVKNIVFGKAGQEIRETWKFTVLPDRIIWKITRQYPVPLVLDDSAFPEWDFSSLSTWTGGLLGNGGVVWNKYLDTTNATYGAHTGEVIFWNSEQHDALRIKPAITKDHHDTVRFSHQPDGTFSFNYVVSQEELKPLHDLRRFLPDQQDLWSPFAVAAGEVNVEFTLQALDYDAAYNRGTFQGVNGESIRELLNTAGHYGVIDTHLVGANGWRSGYICLHEQFFSGLGLALADTNYISNLAAALDFERDHAISPEGRVLARWGYDAGDAMPGTYDPLGFYEAQWGYLMDSQPDYVINVAELYDLTGDKSWLAGQKTACEKALDYLIRREVQGSGLVAMMTDSRKQQRGSDWIDIIWASYENALVNAELYHALCLWSEAEATMGDTAHAAAYRTFAARLKTSFNRPISEGGFWNPTNQWYAYWRDKDGSTHGDNLFTPVNFAAIAYGLCDDPARQKAILDRMETEIEKESLFMWPLNFFAYQPDEGYSRNFPFPNYENGDIFMSWGELGVRAYAAYNPALALKYVTNALARYEADGLSFQRYERKLQDGAGDDILAGNAMPIVGLYRDIYGIQPKPNRLHLEPHLSPELNGTQLRYPLRGRNYVIDLNMDHCAMSAENFTLRTAAPFGVNITDKVLEYFSGTNAGCSLSLSRPGGESLMVQVEVWPDDPAAARRWTESSPEQVKKVKVSRMISHLQPNASYELKNNGRVTGVLRADRKGNLKFTSKSDYAMPQEFELKLAPQ